MTTTIEFRLDPASASATIAKAEKLCERATKKGLSGGWKVIGVTSISERDQFGITRYYDILTIEGTPFTFNGWQFVAAIEWVEGKPFVSTLPGYEGDSVDRDQLKVGYCDHCQTTRKRNKVYIVENSQGRKQVGSSCIKDFLGHDITPSYIIGPSEFDEVNQGWGQTPQSVNTIDALAVAIAVIEQRGWVPASQKYGSVTTRESVAKYLFQNDSYAKEFRAEIGKPDAGQYAKAQTVLNWVANEFTGTSDYAQNLKTAASLERTTQKTLGTLVSAISTYDSARANEAARVVENLAEEQFAPEGERITIPVEVTSVRHFQSAFGMYAYVTFKSATHRFKWKATGENIPEQGDEIVLTGTVKGTDQFNGAVFTVLTRCKFTTTNAATEETWNH